MKRTISFIAAVVFFLSFALTCGAIDIFTKSVTQWDSPALIAPNIPDGEGAVAALYKGDDIVRLIAFDELSIISYTERIKADPDVQAALVNAFNGILDADSLDGVIIGLGDAREDVKADEYIAKKMFELVLAEEPFNMLMGDDEIYLKMTFDTKYRSKDDVPTIAYNCDGTQWKVLDPSNITFNAADGSITVRFYELCTFLFLIPDDGSLFVTDPDVTSPGTMEVADSFKVGTIIAVTAAVVLAGGAAFVLTSKKRSA